MIGAVRLWSQRRKLRRSIPRDPLSVKDPAAWLEAAGSVLHLRASCPEPSWLVHCAYWAGLSQDRILAGALAAGRHVQVHGPSELLPAADIANLRRASFPALVERILDLEDRYPAIRGIEQCLPAQYNSSLSFHLPARPLATFEAATLSPEALVAGGFVLMLVAVFHRDGGLRESLALTCGGMGTLFALGLPHERQTLLDVQRTAYGWPTSMTSTTFVK